MNAGHLGMNAGGGMVLVVCPRPVWWCVPGWLEQGFTGWQVQRMAVGCADFRGLGVLVGLNGEDRWEVFSGGFGAVLGIRHRW